MKHLFEAESVKEVKERLAQLSSDSDRLWGKMNLAQALAHCSLAMEWAVGDRIPTTNVLQEDHWTPGEADGAWERRTDAPEFAYGTRSCGAERTRRGHRTEAVVRID